MNSDAMKYAVLIKYPVLVVWSVLLAACSRPVANGAVEIAHVAPVELVAEAIGELKSTRATPLPVPGQQSSQRQLIWMLADGSQVKAGDVVARFATAQGKLQLAQAMLDLQRNTLAHAAKRDDLDAAQGRVDVDLAQVATQIGIARRYANTQLQMFARDTVLDAVQDQRYLGARQDMLEWERGQSSKRSDTVLAVLDAQRTTFNLSAKTLQGNLDALELVAPHDGVLMLDESWDGQKPQIGKNFWAGQEFASLPDAHAMEVELALPQLDAQGVLAGDVVSLYPMGRPMQTIETRLSWVGSAAQVRSDDSPVKFILMKATVSAQDAVRHAWVPGQRFHARIFVRRAPQGFTIPNVALITESGRTYVAIQDNGEVERREVVLGARGAARSEVTKGLAAGERILLLPPRSKGEGS